MTGSGEPALLVRAGGVTGRDTDHGAARRDRRGLGADERLVDAQVRRREQLLSATLADPDVRLLFSWDSRIVATDGAAHHERRAP